MPKWDILQQLLRTKLWTLKKRDNLVSVFSKKTFIFWTTRVKKVICLTETSIIASILLFPFKDLFWFLSKRHEGYFGLSSIWASKSNWGKSWRQYVFGMTLRERLNYAKTIAISRAQNFNNNTHSLTPIVKK